MSEINAGSTQKRSNQLSLNVGSAYETYELSGSICDCDMIISIPGIATDERGTGIYHRADLHPGLVIGQCGNLDQSRG